MLRCIFLFAILFILGCKDNNILPINKHEGKQIRFNLSILNSNQNHISGKGLARNMTSEKKALTAPISKNDFMSQFSIDDSIGVFAVPMGQPLQSSNNLIHNIKITYNGSEWQGDLVWPEGVANLDFYAYYPYSSTMSNPTNYRFTVEGDQSDINGFSASHLMSSKQLGVATGDIVNLNFNHLLTLVQIEIPSVSTSDPDLYVDENMQVMLNRLNAAGTFNLAANTFQTDGTTFSGIRPYRVERTNQNNYKNTFTYRALIPAQTILADQPILMLSQGLKVNIIKQNSTLNLLAGRAYPITFSEFPKQMSTSFIKGGTFLMGNPNESSSLPEERPLHWVKLKDFYMGKYEVTIGQYVEFLNANKVESLGSYAILNNQNIFSINQDNVNLSPVYDPTSNKWKVNPGYENYPMTMILKTGATAYCDWIGGKLPTEAQWEYAARAGSSTTYFFGMSNDLISNYAWLSSNSGFIIHEVGLKLPNALGLFDIYGNVEELTRDRYANYTLAPYNRQSTQANPIEDPWENSGLYHIIRGGSFGNTDANSFKRRLNPEYTASATLGFRVVFEK